MTKKLIHFPFLAKLSLRLNLLRIMAMNESNPLAQHVAYLLLILKRNRKAGAWHSALTIYTVQGLILFVYFLAEVADVLNGITNQTAQIILTIATGVIVIGSCIGSYFLGLRNGLYPGQKLLSRDPDGNTLRFFNIDPGKLWWSLVKIQIATYLIPIVLACLSVYFIMAIIALEDNALWRLDWEDIFWYLYAFVSVVVIGAGLMFAGLYSGFRFQRLRDAYILNIGVHFGWVAIVWTGLWGLSIELDDFNVPYQITEHIMYTAFQLINLALMLVFAYLSKQILIRRIYPGVK